MSLIIGALSPVISMLLSTIITAAIAYAAKLLKDKLNVDWDKAAQSTLHSALLTAATAALRANKSPAAAAQYAKTYATTIGAADSVKRLKVKIGDLDNLAERFVGEAQANLARVANAVTGKT